MGFPSLVYSHGWVVGLWIASYMLVPLSGFAVLGKRFGNFRIGPARSPCPTCFGPGSPARG